MEGSRPNSGRRMKGKENADKTPRHWIPEHDGEPTGEFSITRPVYEPHDVNTMSFYFDERLGKRAKKECKENQGCYRSTTIWGI